MKQSLLTAWLKALESGKYKQRRERLGSKKQGFCCLGLLCHIAKVKFKEDGFRLPLDFATEIGMRSGGEAVSGGNDTAALARDNDNGKSFKQIASLIRKNPKRFIRTIE